MSQSLPKYYGLCSCAHTCKNFYVHLIMMAALSYIKMSILHGLNT